MKYSPRENLLNIWRRKGFEYIPAQFDLCPSQEEKFKSLHGENTSYRKFFEFPWENIRYSFLKQTFEDGMQLYPGQSFNAGTSIDRWGVAHEPAPGSMHMTRMYHPMEKFSSLEEFQRYPYPEFDDSLRDQVKKQVEDIHSRGLIASAMMACSIWETAWYMRSMEEMMIGMMTDDPLTIYHLDRITELACQSAEAYAACGVDHIHLGDDIGMQHAIMFSVDDYRRFFKERLKSIITAAKAANPDIIVSYHSCGYISPFIPDLIEAGIDVLNPIQPECMSFEEIHSEYGSVLSFWGTIGTQTTFPFGSPEDVRKTTLRNLEIAGKKGGLLCTPTHLVEPEVPWDNIEAYIKALKDFSGIN